MCACTYCKIYLPNTIKKITTHDNSYQQVAIKIKSKFVYILKLVCTKEKIMNSSLYYDVPYDARKQKLDDVRVCETERS